MTQISPQRSRWVTKIGDKELTYIGRDIEGVYHVEALILRTGTSKIAYQFRVPEAAAGDVLAYAGRPPEQVINCEFMVIKAGQAANTARLTNVMGTDFSTVDLSTEWYAEL